LTTASGEGPCCLGLPLFLMSFARAKFYQVRSISLVARAGLSFRKGSSADVQQDKADKI
jgi:hypothetical protein